MGKLADRTGKVGWDQVLGSLAVGSITMLLTCTWLGAERESGVERQTVLGGVGLQPPRVTLRPSTCCRNDLNQNMTYFKYK